MLIFTLSGITIAILITFFKGQYLHPFFLFSTVWAIVIMMWSADGIFNIVGYIPISTETLFIIFIINSSFLIGSISLSLALKRKKYKGIKVINEPKRENFEVLYFSAVLIFVFSLVGYIFYINAVVNSISLSLDLSAMFLEWNYQSSHGQLEEFGGIFGRFYVLPLIGIPLNIYLLNKYKKSKLLILLSFLEFFFLFSPRRALLISTVILSFLTWAVFKEKNLKINFRSLIILFFTLTFFMTTQSWLNKSSGEGIFGGFRDIYIYISGNIPSLQVYLNNLVSFDSYLSFNVLFKIASSIDLTNQSPDLSLKFILIPFEFNTTPYMFYYLNDFGILGTAIYMWILGLVITYIYYKVKREKSFLFVYVYITLMLFIIFSFRENTLIIYNTWYALLVVILVSIFARLFKTRKMVL